MKEEIIYLIDKFLRNEISSEELHKLRSWYGDEKINKQLFANYYAQKWEHAAHSSSEEATENKSHVWRKINKQLQHENPTLLVRIPQWKKIAGVAIIAVLSILLGYSLHFMTKESYKELIVKVENGQKAHITLPDGSLVWLNSASELHYPSDFGKRNRILKLLGEAYFEVESNPDNPFIVETFYDLKIKALGTKFNVKSYEEDATIIGTLLEGKINVHNHGFSENLYADEQIVFDTRQNTYRKSHIENKDEAVFWMSDQLVFQRETLENITRILARMYNVNFEFSSPEIKKIKYTGKIKNNSIENVLSLITTVSPLTYSIDESTIIFSKK